MIIFLWGNHCRCNSDCLHQPVQTYQTIWSAKQIQYLRSTISSSLPQLLCEAAGNISKQSSCILCLPQAAACLDFSSSFQQPSQSSNEWVTDDSPGPVSVSSLTPHSHVNWSLCRRTAIQCCIMLFWLSIVTRAAHLISTYLANSKGVNVSAKGQSVESNMSDSTNLLCSEGHDRGVISDQFMSVSFCLHTNQLETK